ncbi:MAG: translocation/assembly module TamB domain-containing protein, partial [Pseudomonadota bacterium]
TIVDDFTIQNEQISANATGDLNTQSGQIAIEAVLNDVSLLEPKLTGPATLDAEAEWSDGAELKVTRLIASAAGTTLKGSGALQPEIEEMPFAGRADLLVNDLSRFNQLTARSLGGRLDAIIEGTGNVSGLRYEIDLTANSTDLQIGEPMLDPLITGDGAFNLAAKRRGDEHVVDSVTLRFPKLSASGFGQTDGQVFVAKLLADITDLTGVAPGLSGPANLDAAAKWERGGRLEVESLSASGLDAKITASGFVEPQHEAFPFAGKINLIAEDLERFSGLLKRQIKGRVDLNAEGEGEIGKQKIKAKVDLDASEFRTSFVDLDKLVGGDISLQAVGSYGDGPPDIALVKLDASGLKLAVEGGGPGQPISLFVQLRDLGQFAPGFDGPGNAEGNLRFLDREGRDAEVDLSFSGPGGITGNLLGQIENLGKKLALSLNGRAPLGVANRFISPNSIQGKSEFDLRIDGAPNLSALSGQARLDSGRFVLPAANIVLNSITGAIDLANSTAKVSVTGNSEKGGGLELKGPVSLTAPNQANLDLVLSQFGVSRPSLYSTTLNGTVSVNGALAAGATIGGVIDLGVTEIQVPSGSSGAGTIIDVKHVNAPVEVTETRRRAGLIEEKKSGPAAAFPLDLTINAPDRIFIRGRGLDAELGGAVRLFGTTKDVAASGTFELIRGRLDILGKRLTLTEALINLRGALDPFLRVVAETDVDDVTARVILEGLVSDPEVRFESSPDLPQDEVASRLLFGRGLDNISLFQAAQLVGAAATLSGHRSGGLVANFRNQFGLSDFDVTSTDGGATQFTAGAYISDNLYSEVAVDSEGNEEINLNLDVTPQLTVRGSASTDGNSGLGIFFERDY